MSQPAHDHEHASTKKIRRRISGARKALMESVEHATSPGARRTQVVLRERRLGVSDAGASSAGAWESVGAGAFRTRFCAASHQRPGTRLGLRRRSLASATGASTSAVLSTFGDGGLDFGGCACDLSGHRLGLGPASALAVAARLQPQRSGTGFGRGGRPRGLAALVRPRGVAVTGSGPQAPWQPAAGRTRRRPRSSARAAGERIGGTNSLTVTSPWPSTLTGWRSW